MNASTAFAAALSLLIGLALGAAFWSWRLRTKGSGRLPLPERWPLRARAVVNGNEKEVWHALRSIFHDHVVMVKVPVLRFTKLHDAQSAESSRGAGAKGQAKSDVRLKNDQWMEMLNGVHTTFTVCTLEGKVVGCVDVPGKLEMTKANRQLKEALLQDCNIAYVVVNAFDLPDAARMRGLFLGEIAPPEPTMHQVTRGGDSVFHADMAAFSQRHASANR